MQMDGGAHPCRESGQKPASQNRYRSLQGKQRNGSPYRHKDVKRENINEIAALKRAPPDTDGYPQPSTFAPPCLDLTALQRINEVIMFNI
jgi:hypothetical protein